jgi:hypothetical protein
MIPIIKIGGRHGKEIDLARLQKSQARLQTIVAKWILAQTSLTEVKNLATELARDISTFKVGDTVPCGGYSYENKPCRIDEINGTIHEHNHNSPFFRRELIIGYWGRLLKKDGGPSGCTVHWRVDIDLTEPDAKPK